LPHSSCQKTNFKQINNVFLVYSFLNIAKMVEFLEAYTNRDET